MPINTFTCAKCGARTNYTVDIDSLSGAQSVECVRCHENTTIKYDELPERLRETIEELNQSNEQFAEEMNSYGAALDGVDTVEETIRKVDSAFAEAKQEMKAFDSQLKINTDINAIAEQYAPSEDFAKSAGAIHGSSQGHKQSSNAKQGSMKERIHQAANSKARTYAKRKLSERWNASDEEIEDIFAIADSLHELANTHEISVKELIRNYPEAVAQTISENAFVQDLIPQLTQMVDRGSFSELMDVALMFDN